MSKIIEDDRVHLMVLYDYNDLFLQVMHDKLLDNLLWPDGYKWFLYYHMHNQIFATWS